MENHRITKVHSDHKRRHPLLQASIQLLLGHFTVNHKRQPSWWSWRKDQGIHWSVASRSSVQFVSGIKARWIKPKFTAKLLFSHQLSLDWELTCNPSIIVHSQNGSQQTGRRAFGGERTLVVKNYQHQIQLACKLRRGVKGEPILPALLSHLFNDRETLSHCSLSVHPAHPDSLSEPSIGKQSISWWSEDTRERETVYVFRIRTEQRSILDSCLLLSEKEREKQRRRQSIVAEEDSRADAQSEDALSLML